MRRPRFQQCQDGADADVKWILEGAKRLKGKCTEANSTYKDPPTEETITKPLHATLTTAKEIWTSPKKH
ncbi:hypothetical protein [Flagellimonas marinaquae]